jgi:hypothetical protein
VSRLFGNLPEFEIDGIRPAEADHILRVASAAGHQRSARDGTDFFRESGNSFRVRGVYTITVVPKGMIGGP